MEPEIKIKRLRADATLPAYRTERAAALDLAALLEAPLTLPPQARAAVPTGLALQIPPGYEGQIRARSGRALDEGLALVNAPGTIDADYRGEIKIIVINLGEHPIVIRSGERIAQLVIAPVARARIIEVEALEESARGPGGLGHTGR